MSGLLPDLELRNPVAEGSGGETATKRVGAEAAEIADAGARQRPFEDPRHRGRVQAGRLHVLSAVDLAEDRSGVDVRLPQPLFERPHRAGAFGERSMLALAPPRDLDFPALPLLVGFRPGEGNGDPVGVTQEVLDADSGEFRPPEASGEPGQDQGPVPGGGQRALRGIDHPPDQIDGDGFLALLPGPLLDAYASEDLRQPAVGLHRTGRRQLAVLVQCGDRGQLAADGRHPGAAPGQVRDVEADGAGGCGQGFEPGLGAPRGKKPEIGFVGPPGRRAPGRLFVFEGLLRRLVQGVVRPELLEGDAGGRQPGADGPDSGNLRGQKLALGEDPARCGIRRYHRSHVQIPLQSPVLSPLRAHANALSAIGTEKV